MKVLIAVDKFRGSLTADIVAQIIYESIKARNPAWEIEIVPIFDGGEGTIDAIIDSGFERIDVNAVDALSRSNKTYYGINHEKIVFIEMAKICGTAQLAKNELDPYRSTSLGLGIASRDALALNPSRIVISLGGSASNDGGVGFLSALGARLLDEFSQEVSPDLNGLKILKTLDISSLDPRAFKTEWSFLTDVDNPATGKNGATYIYGPQKGLATRDLKDVEETMVAWADILVRTTGKDLRNLAGTGAAGAIALAGCSALPAVIGSASLHLGKVFSLEGKISKADLIITGEGKFDAQSFMGKAPGYVFTLAKKHSKQVAVIAGSIDPQIRVGLNATCLMDFASNLDAAMGEPRKWLKLAISELLDSLGV